MLHDNLSVNAQGHLTVGGVDVCDLAKKYGTPLYVIDEDKVRRNCRIYTEAFAKYFRFVFCLRELHPHRE